MSWGKVQDFVETMAVRSRNFMRAVAQGMMKLTSAPVGEQLAVERRTRSAARRNFKPNSGLAGRMSMRTGWAALLG